MTGVWSPEISIACFFADSTFPESNSKVLLKQCSTLEFDLVEVKLLTLKMKLLTLVLRSVLSKQLA